MTYQEEFEKQTGFVGASPRKAQTVTVELGHRCSVQGARWCKPIGFEPANQIKNAKFIDGAWWSDEEEEAGLICFAAGEEGDLVEVNLGDLLVVSSGACKIIGDITL